MNEVNPITVPLKIFFFLWEYSRIFLYIPKYSTIFQYIPDGILEYSLDSHAERPGSNLTIAAALLSFSKAIYPHCCSRPRCINGHTVGGDRLLCLNLPAPLSAAIPGKECSLGSGNCALYKCGIEMYPMTGVIICCKRFGPHGINAYKN